jgi:hypothetical protein
MMPFSKILFSIMLSLLSLTAFSQEAGTPEKPAVRQVSATVRFSETQYALILSGSSGTGILTFKNKDYPFKLSGMSLGANVGISKISATGEVYDLTDVSKFAGTYSKIESGISIGLGTSGSVLKNENGVMMNLTSTAEGIQVNLSAGGIKVEFLN